MGNNGMKFVFWVILADVCINIEAVCSDHNNTPAVHFCSNRTAENEQKIYIGNEESPRYANNNCSCTITANQGDVSVKWKQKHDTANISFVKGDGKVNTTETTKTITGVVHAIYQTNELDAFIPVCLELTATKGNFSAICERQIHFNNTIPTTTRSHSTTCTPSTNQDSAIKEAIKQITEDNIVPLGPIIGGVCAVIVITIGVIVIVFFIRRKQHDVQNPSKTDEDITTENPIYDRDGTLNDETNIQNYDTNNDAAHYSSVETVGEYGKPNKRSESKPHEYYSKVNKTFKHSKGNTSSSTHNQEHTDHYDSTEVKRDIQPFNEYNHLATVHRYSQDTLGDYDRTNINLDQINKGHDENADAYNTAFSH